jgi:hypothetical protein
MMMIPKSQVHLLLPLILPLLQTKTLAAGVKKVILEMVTDIWVTVVLLQTTTIPVTNAHLSVAQKLGMLRLRVVRDQMLEDCKE